RKMANEEDMGRGFQTPPPTIQPNQQLEFLVRAREERLRHILNPLEPFIMRLQSVLVWENPKHSAVMFLAVNGVFWLSTVLHYRPLYVIATSILIVLCIDTWRNKIWPEIKVPSKEGEDTEGWTPVHPKLLSVPEMSRSLAEIWVTVTVYSSFLLDLRVAHPGRFCLLMSSIFIGTAVLGHYFSGVALSYITVMSLLLWPCMVYHNILQRAYVKIEPFMMQLEYSLKIKRTRSKKSKRKSKRKSGTPGSASKDLAITDSDTDVEEFVPSLDPEITAALARAITDSEDESKNPTPAMLTPSHRSREVSPLHSDDEFIPQIAPTSEMSFSHGLSSIPSYDDTILDRPDPMSQTRIEKLMAEGAADSMLFLPSHFEESDNSDNTDVDIDTGLSFPDLDQVDHTSARGSSHGVREISPGGKKISTSAMKNSETGSVVGDSSSSVMGLPTSAKAMLESTVSTVVESTLVGLNKLSDTVKEAAYSATQQNKTQNNSNDSDISTCKTDPPSSELNRGNSDDSILAEFEFLSREDLGEFDGKTSNQ
ncbi:unnamed protein product, partial [Owenia fusiformis]